MTRNTGRRPARRPDSGALCADSDQRRSAAGDRLKNRKHQKVFGVLDSLGPNACHARHGGRSKGQPVGVRKASGTATGRWLRLTTAPCGCGPAAVRCHCRVSAIAGICGSRRSPRAWTARLSYLTFLVCPASARCRIGAATPVEFSGRSTCSTRRPRAARAPATKTGVSCSKT